MFCPACSTENGSEQSYCRQCGLSLPAVGLALAGRIDEALRKLKKGSRNLTTGLIIFAIGLLNALLNLYFGAWQSAAFSLLLGIAIGVPPIIFGLESVTKASRLLNSEESLKGLSEAKEGAEKRLNPKPAVSGSVTERTTLKLDQSDSSGQQ